MRYIQIYEEFAKPFKSFNTQVGEIIRRLDLVINNTTIPFKIGIIDKNAGKFYFKYRDPNLSQSVSYFESMVVEIRYIDDYPNRDSLAYRDRKVLKQGKTNWEDSPYIKIMINNNFPKKTVYLRFLCDKYCDKIEDSLKNYDYYLLTLNKYDEFIEELTPEAEEMYKDSKIYNI